MTKPIKFLFDQTREVTIRRRHLQSDRQLDSHPCFCFCIVSLLRTTS